LVCFFLQSTDKLSLFERCGLDTLHLYGRNCTCHVNVALNWADRDANPRPSDQWMRRTAPQTNAPSTRHKRILKNFQCNVGLSTLLDADFRPSQSEPTSASCKVTGKKWKSSKINWILSVKIHVFSTIHSVRQRQPNFVYVSNVDSATNQFPTFRSYFLYMWEWM
jgi:hypothetical protein